jgi:hydrogenase large subunit
VKYPAGEPDGVLSLRGRGKEGDYHPYPPTPWNANPRDVYGTPGPYEDAVQNMPIFEENGPDKFKGIDIMRAVRSFDPCRIKRLLPSF